MGIMLALNVGGLALAAVAFSEISRDGSARRDHRGGNILIGASITARAIFAAGRCTFCCGRCCWRCSATDRLRVDGEISQLRPCPRSLLSDWGFALFVVTLSFCWASLGRGRPPWRCGFDVVAVPSAGAFILYEAAVIAAVGWDFFLL